MTAAVDFFYGIGSRYSYLAATQMGRLAADTGAAVRWRPLFSTQLMQRRGMDPFKGAPASGQYDAAYRTRDVSMWADYYGIPFRDADWDALNWQRLALSAVAADRLGAAGPYTLRLYDGVFGDGMLPMADADLAAIAGQSGLDGGKLVALIDDPATQDHHERNLADAIAAGVFGVPAFVTGGQMFWGNDRLLLLRHHLGAKR
ncbi:MAG TPA: DsbA family protein [Dongiaceae bacterium]|jgi:2-hydroxychromene-2-carboxylate isomerase